MSIFRKKEVEEAISSEEKNPDYQHIERLAWDVLLILGKAKGGREESSYLPAVVCKVERADPPRDYGFMKSKHEYGSAWLTLAGGKKFELTGYGNISDIYAYLLTHLDYWPMLDGQDPDTDFSISNLPNTGNRNLYDQASDFMLVVYDNALEAKEALQIYKKRLTDVKNAREQQKINVNAK